VLDFSFLRTKHVSTWVDTLTVKKQNMHCIKILWFRQLSRKRIGGLL
jgi:hypothetical protein